MSLADVFLRKLHSRLVGLFVCKTEKERSAVLSCEGELQSHRTLRRRTPEGHCTKRSFATVFPHVSSLSLFGHKERWLDICH